MYTLALDYIAERIQEHKAKAAELEPVLNADNYGDFVFHYGLAYELQHLVCKSLPDCEYLLNTLDEMEVKP